jgi:hypothetical protein
MEITLPHKFVPRVYQRKAFAAMEKGYKRLCLVWHRRGGKDMTSLNIMITKMVQQVGIYYYLFPSYLQGRKILWDGINKEGMAVLDHFPKELVANKNATEMKITLKNGSLFQIIGTDNYDRIVGTNPIGCVFSEYALQDPAAYDLIRPILAENGGWAIFTYTPRGQNHGKTLFEMAKNHPDEWFTQLLTVVDTVRDDGTPVITNSAIEAERSQGMSDDLIRQEFHCDFDVVGGQAFDFQRSKHVIPASTPIPPFVPLYFSFDWGYGHPFSAQWWYVDSDNRIYHFKEWYGWNGEPNVGLRYTDEEIARGIIEIEKSLKIDGRYITRLSGPDCFNKKPDYRGGGQGPSTAEVFENFNLTLLPGDPSRELKIRQFRSRLAIPADNTRPMMQVYDSCVNFIRTIPLIPVDKNNIEYIDTTSENHTFDAACHICMARPLGISQTDVDSIIKANETRATYESLPALSRIAWDEIKSQNKQIEDEYQAEVEVLQESLEEFMYKE